MLRCPLCREYLPRPHSQTRIHIHMALKCHVPSKAISSIWGSGHLFAKQSLFFTHWAFQTGPVEVPNCALWNHRYPNTFTYCPITSGWGNASPTSRVPVQGKGFWGHCRAWVSWCLEFRTHSGPCSTRRGSQMSWYSLDPLQGGEAAPRLAGVPPGRARSYQILPCSMGATCLGDPSTLGLWARCQACPSFPSCH